LQRDQALSDLIRKGERSEQTKRHEKRCRRALASRHDQMSAGVAILFAQTSPYAETSPDAGRD
jgi:hypothetical protein